MLSRRYDDDAGFTLVELLTVITILSLVGVVVLTSIVRAFDITNQATQRIEVLTALQQAQERLTRVIRAADPIDAATPTTLTLNVLSGGDRQLIILQLDPAGDRVTRRELTYSPAAAATPSGDTTTIVIDQLDMVGAPLFTYATASGPWDPATQSPTDIRNVSITLTGALADAPSVDLTTGVQIRNHSLEPTA